MGGAPQIPNFLSPFMARSQTKTPGSGRASKRQRPELSVIAKDPEDETFPRFLFIHSENQDQPLAKLSPFVVAKILDSNIGAEYKAKKLYSGDLLAEVVRKSQSSTLLKMTSLGDLPVTVSKHRMLNTVRGVISEDDLLSTSEDEILEGLRASKVVSVQRITFKREGTEVKTKHLILTFERHTLPVLVKAGYLNCRVRPYVPNPQRCFRCQRFGHGSRSCRGKETCAKCGSHDHVADICENEVCCANCKGPHPAYSRT